MVRNCPIHGLRAMLAWLVALSTLCTRALASSPWGCDGLCSGHGYCLEGDTVCRCIEGFVGPDCSQRKLRTRSCSGCVRVNWHSQKLRAGLCPAGTAWVDYPKADGTAHAKLVECSNMVRVGLRVYVAGTDTSSCTGALRSEYGRVPLPAWVYGRCLRKKCVATIPLMCPLLARWTIIVEMFCDCIVLCPFEKNALGLPQECSGQGRCLSMRNAAWEASGYEYKPDDWDTDMVHGCVCDPGFEGPSCQLRSCPYGDDPAKPGVHEVQIIECTCLGTCNGSVTVHFRRKSTMLPARATPELVQLKLQRLAGVGDVDVEMHQSDSLCSVAGTATVVIAHTQNWDCWEIKRHR
jgi:hypothetical protein